LRRREADARRASRDDDDFVGEGRHVVAGTNIYIYFFFQGVCIDYMSMIVAVFFLCRLNSKVGGTSSLDKGFAAQELRNGIS
jgi:hypothetical protein